MSIQSEQNSPTTSINVQAFAEQMLMDRIFMGDYQEKRYVTKLNAYRDLIVLNKHEQILAADLINVKNRILTVNLNTWFGFDERIAPAIWTRLDDPNKSYQEATSVVFGEYWFQIKGLCFDANNIEILVKILRPIDPNSSMSSNSTISSLAQQALELDTHKIQQYVQQNITEVDWMMLFNQWNESIKMKTYRFLSNDVTWSNFVHYIHIFGLFFIGIIQLLVNFVHYIGEFTIRLINELTKLIKVLSPIVLVLINLLSKMIGGFYILIAMIWRDLFYGDSAINNSNSANRNNYSRTPALIYRENPRPFLQSSHSRRSTATSPRFN